MRKMSLNSENEAEPRRLGLVADLPGALESALGHRLPVGTAVCAGAGQNLLQPGAARAWPRRRGPHRRRCAHRQSSPRAMGTCIDHTFKPPLEGIHVTPWNSPGRGQVAPVQRCAPKPKLVLPSSQKKLPETHWGELSANSTS